MLSINGEIAENKNKQKKTVYIAGPLFSKAELDFNFKLDRFLKNIGFSTFLPQRDGYLLSEIINKGIEKDKALNIIFQKDVEKIKECDIDVFIMDGGVPDEGACVEIGLAYAYNKECFGLKTDSRCLIR